MNRNAILAAFGLAIGTQLSSQAAGQLLNAPLAKPAEALPDCGTLPTPLVAVGPGTTMERACTAPAKRSYVPKYHGLGYEVLTMESEACFVPDASFQLLDSIVDQARASMNGNPPGQVSWDTEARTKLTAVGDVLAKNGFGVFIPTETLGDALANRSLADGLTHMMDCDTSSLIYLTVAEEVSMPLNLVEITLPSGAGHNYVRWTSQPQATLDWDTNGRAQCRTPAGLSSWQGRSMSKPEVLGYAFALRALVWERVKDYKHALADYRSAIAGYPAAPGSYNNLAWLVAAKADFTDPALLQEGLTAAQHAVSVERSANYLDTLACMRARLGNFPQAIIDEQEAVSRNPYSTEFKSRLDGFKRAPAQNCLGAP